MIEIAIRVSGLSKRYRIGAAVERPESAHAAVGAALRSPFRYLERMLRPPTEEETLWALKDISFEVKPGEVVGIIGRNGAGKSTLLKILSRITEPTEGFAELHGRVGSLLEVGVGFSPELTGRENIRLNGAILGMKRAEIARKFDEIVAFSEIERFLDTPVKHYSSGMYVRLAFAVAAHLQPEILVVDEVLAVGDLAFQRKCMGKMGSVAREGRTVLFVSHNMSAVVSLCTRCLMLDQGRLIADGGVAAVIAQYCNEPTLCAEVTRAPAPASKFRIERVQLLKAGSPSATFENSETATLRIECQVGRRVAGAQVAIELITGVDDCILSSTSQDVTLTKEEFAPGRYVFECPIALTILREGAYRIKVAASVPGQEMLDVVETPLAFQLHEDNGPVLALGQNRRGVILPILPWSMRREP